MILDHQRHESDDFALDENSMTVGVYASGVFDSATQTRLAAAATDVAQTYFHPAGNVIRLKQTQPPTRCATEHGQSATPRSLRYLLA